jgi:hypothetical protein
MPRSCASPDPTRLLATIFLPFLSQLYWIWQLWNETGKFLNTLTILCLVWIVVCLFTLLMAAAGEKSG